MGLLDTTASYMHKAVVTGGQGAIAVNKFMNANPTLAKWSGYNAVKSVAKEADNIFEQSILGSDDFTLQPLTKATPKQ